MSANVAGRYKKIFASLVGLIHQHESSRKAFAIPVLLVLIISSGQRAFAQSCSALCAADIGPSADFPKAQYQKYMNTCEGQCATCQAKTAPTGFLYPKFYVLGLVYSPPGCTKTATLACSTQSSVDYQNGSSMGTKVSTSDSYENGIDIKVDGSIGLGDGGKGGTFAVSASGGYATTSTDTSSQTISKSSTLEIKASGNQDGVDHDQDLFILLLNPAFAVQEPLHFTGPLLYNPPLRSAGHCSATGVLTNFGINTKIAPNQTLYKLTVAELKNPALMTSNVAAQLKLLNFTNTDFQTILALDPYANGSPAVDTNRYALTTYSFPYEPTNSGTDCNGGICSCTLFSESFTNDLETDTGSSYKTEYKTGLSETLNGIDAGFFKFGETATLSFTWTSSSSTDDLTGSKQSASASIQCPSVAYNAPETEMQIYWDKLFGSFMFVPTVLSPAILSGAVTTSTGQPIRHQPVTLSLGAKTLHSYTNSKGNYAFATPASFVHPVTGQLSAMGTSITAKIGSTQNIKTSLK